MLNKHNLDLDVLVLIVHQSGAFLQQSVPCSLWLLMHQLNQSNFSVSGIFTSRSSHGHVIIILY